MIQTSYCDNGSLQYTGKHNKNIRLEKEDKGKEEQRKRPPVYLATMAWVYLSKHHHIHFLSLFFTFQQLNIYREKIKTSTVKWGWGDLIQVAILYKFRCLSGVKLEKKIVY